MQICKNVANVSQSPIVGGVLDDALENHLPAPEGVVGADGDEIPLMIQGRVWT